VEIAQRIRPVFRGAGESRTGSRIVVAAELTANDAFQEPNDQSTRFQASSISKQFVAVCALMLAERGMLDLAAPIARTLPDAPAAWSDVTMHRLLSHTAGFGHWKDIPNYDIMSPTGLDALLQAIAGLPLLSKPGTGWQYSGPGYALASKVIETAAGTTYAEFVTESIFRPVGMVSTTSGTNPEGPGVALGHIDGRQTGFIPRLAEIPGTGDLWSTPTDLTTFAHALHRGDLISPASLRLMTAAHASVPDASSDGWAVATGYGYGLYVGTAGGRHALFHAGDNPGYRSWLGWFPEEATAIAVMSNEGSDPAEPIAEQFADQISEQSAEQFPEQSAE
jgi:CubicO group peptidase (beta-lactamase class C family)